MFKICQSKAVINILISATPEPTQNLINWINEMSVISNFTEAQNRIKDLVLENEELTRDVIGPLYQQFESFTKEDELKTGTYQYQYILRAYAQEWLWLDYLVLINPLTIEIDVSSKLRGLQSHDPYLHDHVHDLNIFKVNTFFNQIRL